MAKEIPGPKGWPLIGNVGVIDPNTLHVSLAELKKTYGPIFQFFAFSERIVVISDMSLLEKAFNRQEMCYRPYIFSRDLKYNGSGYLDSNFTDREILLKSVLWRAIGTNQNNNELIRIMGKERGALIDSLDLHEDIPFLTIAKRSVAKQYSSAIMGIEATDKHSDAVIDYLNSLRNMFADGTLNFLSVFPWLRYIPGRFKSATNWIIQARDRLEETLIQDARNSSNGILFDMKSGESSTENENQITNDNLKACTMDLLFNMVLPTTENLAFVILQSIKYPDLQQKIHDELNLTSRTMAIDQIQPENVPFTNAFILECMRYLTFVNVSFQHYTNEDAEVDGYLFPKGTTILGDFFGLQHDETIWDKPWQLKPDRFLNDCGELLHPSDPIYKQVVHFSLGVRKCPGKKFAMEKIFQHALAIFTKYRVLPPTNSELPSNDPRVYPTHGVLKVPDFDCRFQKK